MGEMRKILTVPSDCVYPTQDNIEGNLVVLKGDTITKSQETSYMVIELLGVGTFGQVFRCVSNLGEEVAIKVVKSIPRYFQYGMNEVRILKRLKELDMPDRFVMLSDAFIYKQHLCIVLEVLGMNLYELTKIFRFNGMNMLFLKTLLHQVLEGLHYLHSQGITHCDIKPENLLISDPLMYKVKIIDFGSSCTRTLSSTFYIQSRYYRAPEVILGIPYSSTIDMWSFGCLAYELFSGRPLFPGKSNKDQIVKIYEFFEEGLPQFMLDHGENTSMLLDPITRLESLQNTDKFTKEKMIQKIREKNGKNVDSDFLIDLILKALNPSYIERALPHTLLKHRFFNDFAVQPDPSNGDRVCAKPFSVTTTVPKDRKMSMCDLGSEFLNEEPYSTKRKGSVFDPTKENRFI